MVKLNRRARSSARRCFVASLVALPAATAAAHHIWGCPGLPGQVQHWYVDPSAVDGSGDGRSWENAFLYLGSATERAASCNEPDEIWVAAGTYYPDRDPQHPNGSGDTNATFRLSSRTKIYGGFLGLSHPTLAGGETDLSQRDPNENVTILSGDIGVNYPGDSHHVVSALESGFSLLDGFVIEGGDALGNAGGGLFLRSSSPVFVRCTFRNNRAARGAGAYVFAFNVPIRPQFIGCTFVSNHATGSVGGAVSLDFAAVAPFECPLLSDVIFVNCAFSGNTAPLGGGALAAVDVLGCEEGRATLRNCTFSQNLVGATSAAGAIDGAGSCVNHAAVVVHNSVLWGNGDLQIDDACLGVTMSHSIVEGQAIPGPGNLAFDPVFCDPDGADGIAGTSDDNLRLLDGSPAIDGGDDVQLPADAFDLDGDGDTTEPLPMDRDGHARQFDAVSGEPVVDMGAYENQRVDGCPWDLNGDGVVDTADVTAMLAAWGPCPGCGADFDCGTAVNVTDFLTLLRHWGTCP